MSFLKEFDLCTVLGVCRQGFDLRDLIGSAINFAHHTDHHFLYVLAPTGRG